ncbi:hypothetical protein [Haloarcula amylovorans]|uniref:hypothetical protein n=1 Tax=Haloarcula amylovorans TaxID=2562280 RepID=UPI001076082E|nr:hypothetical protein [Halomicroarcula amylolytica]
MQSIDYLVSTFLSQPDEVAALSLTAIVFTLAAANYPDSRDKFAVMAGVAGLGLVLSVVDTAIAFEWHYWVGGIVLFGLGILFIDDRSED